MAKQAELAVPRVARVLHGYLSEEARRCRGNDLKKAVAGRDRRWFARAMEYEAERGSWVADGAGGSVPTGQWRRLLHLQLVGIRRRSGLSRVQEASLSD